MGVLTRSNFPDVLDPAFRKIYTDAEKEIEYKYSSIFNIFNSSKDIEKDSSVSGLTKLTEVGEGEAVPSDTVYLGYDKTYTHKKFGKKTTITEEMVEDDQFRAVAPRAKGLAISANRSIELSGADVLNYGTTSGGGGMAAFTSGGDAKALFANDHPRSDGGATQDNENSMDLAEDAIETITVTMAETLDDRGELIQITADTIIIPPALEREAKILLQSSGRVGTANNDINVYQGALNLVVWPFISAAAATGGSDTAYYVLDSKNNKLNWFWRRRQRLDNDVDFDTGNMEYKLTARWSCGFSDWRGIFGSSGDNA